MEETRAHAVYALYQDGAIDSDGTGRRRTMMKWEAEEKDYTCNDCFLSMQNCNDRSIACEDETGLCDWFEEMVQEGEDNVKK